MAEIENSMIIIKEIVRGEQKKARVIKGLLPTRVKAASRSDGVDQGNHDRGGNRHGG